MEEPYWLPRTAEEYLQQVAEDSGPQPDETALLQRDIDAAEAEVARLTARLAERDAEVARLARTLRLIADTDVPTGQGDLIIASMRGAARAALAARGGEVQS